jgi:hypothetical protein
MNRSRAGSSHPARTLRERAHWNDIGATSLPSPARMAAEIPGAPHAVAVTRPEATAQLIVEAATVAVAA